MKVLIIIMLVVLPTLTNSKGYYDSLLNGLTGINVEEILEINHFHNESESSAAYKLELEKATEGYLYDRISGFYIETLSSCKMVNGINKALLVKSKQMSQLFLENGYSCGIKDVLVR